jgi:predicted ATPase/DNA-binding winged helix-turn-helix (wHTH) protein
MADAAKAFLFGRYRLIPDRRALFADTHEIPLGGRAFDLLLALVERRTRVVLKNELIELVWPGRVVDEGNLTVHIAGLRKLLGKGIIATLPGRGYRFVAAVEEAVSTDSGDWRPEQDSAASLTSLTAAPSAASDSPFLPHTVPRPLTRLVGRAGDLDRVETLLGSFRLTTIVGPGGIGKTRLALAIAVADGVRRSFPDGVWLADFGPVEDAQLVPTAIASALGIEIRDGEVLRAITLFLSAKRGLLIVDGCEHLLRAVATAAEAILRACPNVAILSTSREPLRAEGESLHRLEPLRMAPATAEIGANQLSKYPASEVFVERARAVLGDFAPTDADAREVVAICRRLNGIPLAIELAVPMLQALPLAELRERLDSRFGLLTAGRRTALPRQQTLRATIGWSLDLLDEAELDLLLRLSVFTGGWTAEAATSVARRPSEEDETFRVIAALVDKSLVHADLTQAQPRYRMLDSTRYYAAERLSPHDLAEARGNLVRWLSKTYARAEVDWPFMADEEWFQLYAPEIENLRAGIAWAFGPNGDEVHGVELTSYTEHVWGELSLAAELRHWFDLAITRITDTTPPDVAGRLWLGRCGWPALGDTQALVASQHAVALFRIAENQLDLGRALWRQAFQHIVSGNVDAAEPFLQEAGEVLRGVRESKALVSWFRAQALARSSQRQLDAAHECLAEALSLARHLRSRRDIALTLGDIAEVQFAEGRVNDAIGKAEEALASLGPSRNRSAWVQHIAGALASYMLAMGDIARARPIAARRLELARMMGLRHEVVANLERLGLIAAIEGDLALGGRLLGHSKSYHSHTRTLRSCSSLAVHDRLQAELHARLSSGELERLISEGEGLSDDEAIAELSRIIPLAHVS